MESPFPESGGEARLTAAETSRTVIEVTQHISTMKTRRKMIPSCKFIVSSPVLVVPFCGHCLQHGFGYEIIYNIKKEKNWDPI